jgi:hypothetical protein
MNEVGLWIGATVGYLVDVNILVFSIFMLLGGVLFTYIDTVGNAEASR